MRARVCRIRSRVGKRTPYQVSIYVHGSQRGDYSSLLRQCAIGRGGSIFHCRADRPAVDKSWSVFLINASVRDYDWLGRVAPLEGEAMAAGLALHIASGRGGRYRFCSRLDRVCSPDHSRRTSL
jgi:hypothetical protein